MIDDEYLLVTFNEHYDIPWVLLVRFESDAIVLYPMGFICDSNKGFGDKNGMFWSICP